MCKLKIITFVEAAEGRDSLTHGGVTFVPGVPVTVDPATVEMSPWFEGNPSFTVEDSDEVTENQNHDSDNHAGAGNRGVGQDADQQREERPAEVKPPVKRARRKAGAK